MDYENQEMLEHLFNSKQARPLLMRELEGNRLLQELIDHAEEQLGPVLPRPFMEDVLIHLMQAKRATVPALAGMLRFHFAQHVDSHQHVANALVAMLTLQMVKYDEQRMQIVVLHEACEKTQELLRQYMYLPPMIIPPIEIKDTGANRGSGYITQRGDSLLLQDNHHDGDLCISHLNRMNQVPLALNDRIVKTLRNHWKNIETCKPGESFEEYQERLRNFEKYEKDSFLVMALMIEMGNKFYLTHKYDKRGRSYCQGYQVNYQGNCYNKAVIELANKEHVL